MSSIERLSIQGIRSFGAKAEDAQSITFTSPVTLILGENGCGKTTIIECLKYALTGECPPGSDRGKNFVHDPKIFGIADSLGQIKLIVRKLNGERLSVCRSMRISHRRGKFVFETLDSTVNYLGTDDNPDRSTSLSKRLTDADAALCDFMGVSKAIINNVLFCHQEDSSWPLDEGKKLKEKFDAIFGIVEHNKAVERIIKMRKERNDELKVLVAHLQLLEHLKKEMEDKTLSLNNAQRKCDSIKDECKRCEDEMKPIDERLAQILKIEMEVGKYQAQKLQLETKQKNCDEQISSLSKKIQKPFDGDLDELDTELRAFDKRMSEKQVQQHELSEDLQKLETQRNILHKTYNEYDKKRVLMVQQRQNEQECIAKRAQKMKALCEQLQLPAEDDYESIAQERVVDILEDIENSLLNKETQIAEMTAQHDSEDQTRQTAIDTLRVEFTRLEETITTLEKQFRTHNEESKSLDTKILEIEKSTATLQLITSDIEKLEACHQDALRGFIEDEERKKIADSKSKLEKYQKEFKRLDERLTFLNSISKLMAEINLKQQELEKKEQEIRRVKSKHGENLRKIVGKPVENNFKRTLQTACEQLQKQINDLKKREQTALLKEQSYDIKRKNLVDEIKRLEKELDESKEKVYEKCRDISYEELLIKSEAAVTKYQIEFSAASSSENMYKSFIQKIESDPCCPICHKSMSSDEAADINSELNDEIHGLPTKIAESEKKLKAERKNYESLLQLRPVIEKVAKLERDLPKRKDELKEIQAKLTECGRERETLKNNIEEPNTNYTLANAMLGDMSLLDEALKEVSRLKESIEKLKNKLPPGADSNENIEELQIEKSTISAELEDERKHYEQLQNDFQKRKDAINKLIAKINECKDKRIKLQEGMQSLPQMKERRVELIRLIQTTGNNLQQSKGRVQPLKLQLSQLLSEKARLKESNRKKVNELQKKLDTHKSLEQEVKRFNKDVQGFQKLNLETELTKLKESLRSKKSEIEKNNESYTNKNKEYETIKTECVKQESIKRDLKDNRELKLLQVEKTKLAEDYELLIKQVGDLDYRKALREKTSLTQKRDQITIRKSESLGKIGEINNQIKKLEQEIEEPKYKDSLVNYRRANNRVEIKKAIIADLGRYRLALEWSLIQFHAEKMKRINSLIREYWRLIYRGNDIDYIEIKTDELNTDGSAADKRRNYNYRVIQSKNDTEIEMRGRCSAGQRVLASLIIRMALAETFSSNCGVLALDEPTTNLDRQNILSLCDALNRIVEERQFQNNFMIIIITHDEDFILRLGKIENYHRVFRNTDCKSVIRKVKIG